MQLLDKLITPTQVGRGDGQMPAYVRLLGRYDIEKYPFIKDLMFESRNDVDFCWLANDDIYKENENSFKHYSDGCYSLKDGKRYPVERRIGEPWNEDMYRYMYNLSLKTRNNYEPSKLNFNVCLCMEISVDAYLQLVKVDKSYLPYKKENQKQEYYFINFGEQFNVIKGIKGNQKIAWCVLNPKVLNKAIKEQGTKKTVTDEKILICDLGNSAMSNFTFRCEDMQYFKSEQENPLFRDLNNQGEKKYSYTENAFLIESALLRGQKSKKKTVIETKASALKKDFMQAMQNNPEVLRELIPLMKEFINAEENRTL